MENEKYDGFQKTKKLKTEDDLKNILESLNYRPR